MAVKFVDAVPPSTSGRGELQAWLDEIKANPGKWAKRPYKGRNSAASTVAVAKRQGFEATTRGPDLYVRWPEQ